MQMVAMFLYLWESLVEVLAGLVEVVEEVHERLEGRVELAVVLQALVGQLVEVLGLRVRRSLPPQLSVHAALAYVYGGWTYEP